jgi:hypothetical protein
MSATLYDAVNGVQNAILGLDSPPAPLREPTEVTEDLADEITSELGTPRRAAPLAPVAAPTAADRLPAAGSAAGEAVLRGRYRLEKQIGNGGAATVHRAVDLRRSPGSAGDGRHVAIKLLRPELRGRPQAVARLQREFRQTQAVAHPNVVRFHDLDCEGDAWFIVMELLSGETLGQRLRRRAPSGLAVPDALNIALATGDALAHAHARGVTHGDVKPDNVFLTDTGEVRLIDFGVAPDGGSRPGGDVQEAPVPAAATRVYASPEVLAGDAPQPRDDVFSFACLVHEMIAGRHPYGRRGVDRARAAAVVPERLASLRPEPASVLLAALSLSRAHRPSLPELLRALGCADEPSAPAPGLPVPAVPEAAADPVVTILPVTTSRSLVPVVGPVAAPAAPGSRRGLLAACVAIIALLVGILIGRLAGTPDPAIATASAGRQAQAVDRPPAPTPSAAPIAGPAQEPKSPEQAAAEAAAARPRPSGPPGLVFFDFPRMVVSGRAVVAPIPLRHLSRERRAVRVHWRAIDGSARAGRDYGGPKSGVEHFVEGNSFRILYVPLIAGPAPGRDRSFTIELTEVSGGAALGPTARVEVTILGDP